MHRDSGSERFVGSSHSGPAVKMFRMLSIVAALLLMVSSVTHANGWADARQLVLVRIQDWDTNHGTLQTFTRTEQGWQAARPPTAVTIGRQGAAWGAGLHTRQPGTHKREGDGRSPAGVFRIGDAFGYAASARTGLRYTAMTESDYCIDVERSPLYNRIVDERVVGRAAIEGSTEPMRRDIHANGDHRYKLGFIVEHNGKRSAGLGSCIFAHIWKEPGAPTAGCTAMEEEVLVDLVAWLDATKHPIFVLLPEQEYERLRAAWNLPIVDMAR